MRKIVIGIGVVILVVIVAVGIFAATFNVNSYHDVIQSKLQEALGRKVSLGDMSLGFFPLRFKVQNVSIADDPSFHSSKPFIQAREFDVSVQLMPLLQKEVQVDSLNIQQPSVELIQNEKGMWNFASIGSKTPSAGQPAAQPTPFSLNELTLTDGQVAMTDEEHHTPRSVYDHINLTLKNFAANQPFDVDASANLPGPGNQEVRLQGQGGPIPPGNTTATPFHGTLTLKNVVIGGLQKFLNSPALVGTDGIVSGETKITSQAGKVTAQGETSLQNGKIQGNELGFPVAANYNLSDDLNAEVLNIQNTTIKLGSTPFEVSGTVNSKPNPAQLDLNLRANNVSAAELIQLAGASGKAFAPGMKFTGTLSANINAKGAADKPALNGSLNVRNLQASGGQLAQPVQVSAMNLTFNPTVIQSDNFAVVSGGTTVNAQFTLKQYTEKTPMVDATLKAPNAGLPQILSMAKAYGIHNLDPISGQGTLSMDLHASGPVDANASNALMRTLNGAIKVALNNVKYTGVDIDHEFASIGGLGGLAHKANQGFTNISKVTGDIAVKNGVAQTSNLQALLDIGTINTTGTTDLVSQALNMHVTAVIPKAAASQMGGVGGLMTTALANPQGDVVIPAIVTGTFANPHYAPDVQQIAQMKVKGVLGGLLGQGTGTAGQQSNPAQQLLGIFGKKK